jgi:hypothetical protein
MKVTVVPAQVTTVEDRIIGSLGVSQLLLLSTPIFGGTFAYAILPPLLHSAVYKLILIALMFAMGGLLAIRIKGKILLLWLVVILRYNLRPGYYVFNKRSLHGREQYNHPLKVDEAEDTKPVRRPVKRRLPLTAAELVRLYGLLENPAANVHFEIRKGGSLYVRATEVKQEG